MFSMRPEPDDYSIRIPVTFDYKGGRNENKRNQIILALLTTLISIVLIVIILSNEDNALYKKLIISSIIFLITSVFLRFFVFKETIYSDIFEGLKEVDFIPDSSCYWTIYDIGYEYPYICHYTNGLKGIFVRMEKDVVVGKSDHVMYDHFEAISDALNMASSMNINMYHVDYMDNVGNDSRLKAMYDDLKNVDNPDMLDVMLDIYQNLEAEMSRDYSSFDIYVFFTKDKLENFVYNVHSICGEMLGGNFISYKILDTNSIRQSCISLLNLKDFSVIDATEVLLKNSSHAGIVPISIEHADGTVDKINKTTEEKRIEMEERLRREQEEKENAKKNKSRGRKTKQESVAPKDTVDDKDEDLGLF